MKYIIYSLAFILCLSCSQVPLEQEKQSKAISDFKQLELGEDFKSYWFDGKAELTSYTLSQMRYGEARQGNAVLIFVKEPFLNKEQVKANRASSASTDIIKLNYTKSFNTGIYPYSIMQSVFSPLTQQPHALKVTATTQEWCGQTFMQLNNRASFSITSHSYFEGEADQQITLTKNLLENELWIKLRINPITIPKGTLNVIPDFSYVRLSHKPIKSYEATVSQRLKNDTLITSLKYTQLDRELKIYQDKTFPFQILKWQEIEKTGVSEARLQNSLKIEYWNKNANRFKFLRDSLGL